MKLKKLLIAFMSCSLSILIMLTSCKSYSIQDPSLLNTLDNIHSNRDGSRDTEIDPIITDSSDNGFFVYRFYSDTSSALMNLQYLIVSDQKVYFFSDREKRDYRLAKSKLRKYLTKDQMAIIRERIFVNRTW